MLNEFVINNDLFEDHFVALIYGDSTGFFSKSTGKREKEMRFQSWHI